QVLLQQGVDVIASPGTLAHQRENSEAVQQGEHVRQRRLGAVGVFDGVDPLSEGAVPGAGAKVCAVRPLVHEAANLAGRANRLLKQATTRLLAQIRVMRKRYGR